MSTADAPPGYVQEGRSEFGQTSESSGLLRVMGCYPWVRPIVCDNLAFFGEVTAHRKHTVNVFRDLPDLIYTMLSKISSMRARLDGEITAMKSRDIAPPTAHHLMVEAIRANVLPASRLPKVIEAWEEPTHAEFSPRTAWSLFNAFTEIAKTSPPRAQIDGSLRLSSLFRRELQLA